MLNIKKYPPPKNGHTAAQLGIGIDSPVRKINIDLTPGVLKTAGKRKLVGL